MDLFALHDYLSSINKLLGIHSDFFHEISEESKNKMRKSTFFNILQWGPKCVMTEYELWLKKTHACKTFLPFPKYSYLFLITSHECELQD